MPNVLFGAEMDSSGFKKGSAEIVEGLQEMKEKNEALIETVKVLKAENLSLDKSTDSLKLKIEALKNANKDLADRNSFLTKEMKAAEAEGAKLDKQLANINKTTSAGRKEYSELNKQIAATKSEVSSYTNQITANSKAYLQNTLAIRANKEAIAQNGITNKANAVLVKESEAAITANAAAIKKTEKALEDAGQSTNKFVGGVKSAYGGVRLLANIIPGLGISGIFLAGFEAIKLLLESLDLFNQKLSDAERQQGLMTSITNNAADSYGKEQAKLDVLVASLQSEKTSREDKFAILKEIQKEYPGYFDDIKTEADLTNKVADAYERASKGILAKASANAGEGLLSENIKKRLTLEKQFTDDSRKLGLQRAEALDFERNNFSGERQKLRLDEDKKQFKDLADQRAKAFGEEVSNIDKDNKFLLKKILDFNQEVVDLGGKDPLLKRKEKKAPKGPENVFAEQLADLRAKLAAAQASEFQSQPLIETKFREQLNKEFANIDKLLKEKKLTGPQADILKGLIRQINDIDLSKSLEEFRKKQKDAIQKVNDEIAAAVIEDSGKRVANIRDEFEKEKEGIEAGYQSSIAGIKKQFDALRKGIDEEVKKGFIDKKTGQEKKNILAFIFGDLSAQAEQDKINKQLDLAFKIFEDAIKEKQRALQSILVQNDERTALISTDLVNKFLDGKISYQKYQEGLTQLAKDAARIRINVTINELKTELAAVTAQLATTTDGPIKKKLQDQQLQIRKQIADLTAQQADAEGKADNEASQKKIKNLISYANAIQGVLASVVSFWNQINAVESAALDRSIALQQKRVDNAQAIADRGNAEYLEIEQKRLDDLQRKKEENARKQIAINNALTLSNATVAAVGAIAEAVSTGSPLLAIAALAAVIGAIGAAFAFADSLTPQSASFYEGVESVQGTGSARGKDTVKANLNIGERVITTDTNAAYWDTLTAIHNHNIPPTVLNEFVKSYPSVNIPNVDFDTLNEATNNKLGSDSFEVARRLDSTNEKLDSLLGVMAGLKVEASIDENGLGVSLTNHIRNMNIKKRM